MLLSKVRIALLSLFLFGAVQPVVQAGPLTIDNFSEPANVTQGVFFPSTSFAINDLGLSTSNTIGGTRVGSVSAAGMGAGDSFTVAYGSVQGSALTVGTVSATAQINVALTYNANGVGLNADFGGEVGIAVDFNILDATAVGTELTLTLTDGDGRVFEQTVIANTQGPQTVLFDFTSFTQTGGPAGSLNLSDIDTILFTGSIPPSGDIRIDAIASFSDDTVTGQEIPEPASIAVWGVLGFAGVWYGRRRLRITASYA